MRRGTRGITITEVIVSLTVLVLILGGLWNMLISSMKAGEKTSSTVASVSHAEMALAVLAADLRCMAPPDPSAAEPSLRVAEDGRGIAFLRVSGAKNKLVAEPVVYRAHPTGRGKGNFILKRNGKLVGGVLLRELSIKLVLGDGVAGGSTQETRSNPQLRVRVIGVSADRVVAAHEILDTHELSLVMPLPDTTPAAIPGLPDVARQVLADSLTIARPVPESF